jgi:Flp pilus assembly protein TadG
MQLHSQRRRGATVVECALVFPVFIGLVFGLVVGGMGVFYYQEVASLAREGARYAAVHGAQYAQVTGRPPATPQDVYNNAIAPKLVVFQPNQINYSVTWNPDNNQGSLVTVQVTYHWIPEAFLVPIDLTSTATLPVSY